MEACNVHRRAVADVYKSRMDTARMVKEPEGSTPVYTRFPLFAGHSSIGSQLYRFGVRRMYPRAISDEPAIQSFLARPGRPTPGARQIAESLITLPTHSRITPSIAHEISALLQEEHSC
jgi:dTDP-4-amino-4,6-dideoxygalactose transaminase